MDTRKVSQEVQDKVLGQVRKGQESMAGALRAAANAAQSVTPPAPVLPPSLASRLPSRDELVSGAHDLAEQLLAVQRKATELLDTQRRTNDLQTLQRKATEFLDAQRRGTDRQSLQHRANELLDAQRKLADRAIDAVSPLADRAYDAVSPLLARAGMTPERPADAVARITGRSTRSTTPAAGTHPNGTAQPVPSAKTAAPAKTRTRTAKTGATKTSTTKSGTTKTGTTKASPVKKASTSKKPSTAKRAGPAGPTGATGI